MQGAALTSGGKKTARTGFEKKRNITSQNCARSTDTVVLCLSRGILRLGRYLGHGSL